MVNIDRMHFHRFSSTPLENNVVIAQWDPKDERIYFWCNNSFPSFAIQFLAAHLHVHIDRIRVQTYDIGGSFGIKITSYPQMAVCALASKKAGGRPDQVGGDALRAHDLERPRQRAHLPRHPRGARQERRHYRD